MNFNNNSILFYLFIYVKKCFMIKFNIPPSRNLYTFQNTKYYIKIF